MTVLDASALLAFLFREEGHEKVIRLLEGSVISSVNHSEVIGRFTRDGHDPRLVVDNLSSLPVRVVAFDGDDAMITASLLPVTRQLGLSFADRACLALSVRRSLPVVTADRAWADLDIGLDIHVIR